MVPMRPEDSSAKRAEAGNESEHGTPGPWRISTITTKARGYDIMAGDYGRRVASVPANRYVNNAIRQADAALIAAAPELYEQLVFVTNTLAYLKGEGWETINSARRVLAKARGEPLTSSHDAQTDNRSAT